MFPHFLYLVAERQKSFPVLFSKKLNQSVMFNSCEKLLVNKIIASLSFVDGRGFFGDRSFVLEGALVLTVL